MVKKSLKTAALECILTPCLHLKDDISVTDILKISKITRNYLQFFYKISKNLKAFTVYRESNEPQQLSLSPGLPPAKSGRACYDKPNGKGVFLSDVQHAYLYNLFN